jgi:hypothetical protein
MRCAACCNKAHLNALHICEIVAIEVSLIIYLSFIGFVRSDFLVENCDEFQQKFSFKQSHCKRPSHLCISHLHALYHIFIFELKSEARICLMVRLLTNFSLFH